MGEGKHGLIWQKRRFTLFCQGFLAVGRENVVLFGAHHDVLKLAIFSVLDVTKKTVTKLEGWQRVGAQHRGFENALFNQNKKPENTQKSP